MQAPKRFQDLPEYAFPRLRALLDVYEPGAAPIAMPVPAVPSALSKKVVDGTLLPWEIIAPLKLQNQIGYFIEGHEGARLGTTSFQVSMNQARWDGLPADIQKAFKDASGRDWWAEVGKIWRAGDDFGIKLAKKAGKTHIQLTEAETQAFMDALAPVEARWIEQVGATGIDAAGIVKRAKALIAENAK